MVEWTLLQSLIHGAPRDDRLVAALMSISVSVVALTAGLALLTFVKAYGIAFLARPRTKRMIVAGSGAVLVGVGGTILTKTMASA